MTSVPKVSVVVTTYKHSDFIEQCLSSIFRQDVDFPYEVVIGDDLSPDDTRALVQRLVQDAPCEIQLLFPDDKIGPNANLQAVHKAARGEYVAVLDGDDAMLPGRLQKSVDFLDRNPDCSFVGHKVLAADEVFERPLYTLPERDHPEKADMAYLAVHGTYMVHSAKMYRRVPNLPSEDDPMGRIDIEEHFRHADTGKIGFINEVLGVYRTNVQSSMTNADPDKLRVLFDITAATFDDAARRGVDAEFCRRLKNRYMLKVAVQCVNRNANWPLALEYLDRLDWKVRDSLPWRGAIALASVPGLRLIALRIVAAFQKLRANRAAKQSQLSGGGAVWGDHLSWVRSVGKEVS